MTVPATSEVPEQRSSPGSGLALHAEPGDTLVIDGAGMAVLPRTGTIIAVIGYDGSPPYLVRWTSGDYESRISPGPCASIERRRV